MAATGEAIGAAPRHGRLIARFAAAAADRPLPEDVALKTRLHIIDTLAAIVSGSTLEAGFAGQRYAASVGARPVATILGTSIRTALVEATLANGMAAHADESDDSHETSQTHPGCGVLPAALAAAEVTAATGEAFLRAVNLGYEITIRFGEAMAPAMSFARSSLSCHAYGPLFGAGFAAGSLMGFSEEQFLILLNYLAQEASGLTTWRLDKAHTLKSYVFAAMPASNGLKAAALVRSGFTGNGDVLDPGDRNFFDALSSDMVPDALYRDLGAGHRILETDFKKYSVGFPIAAPVAALEQILSQENVRVAEMERLTVRYDPDWYKVIGDENRMPDLSLRYCLAVTLIDGALTFAASHDEARMSAEDVRAVGSRIALLPNDPGQDRFEARIELDQSGRTLTAAQGLHVRGRKENPMTPAEVHAKAIELMNMAISASTAEEAISVVHDLKNQPTLDRLIGLLTTGHELEGARRSGAQGTAS
jgi:2-methylcitrate dehydratase PrpD